MRYNGSVMYENEENKQRGKIQTPNSDVPIFKQ